MAGIAPSRHGGELRARRERRGLSQRKLARRLGISAMTVSRWEHGEPIPAAHAARVEQMLAAVPAPPSMTGEELHGRREQAGLSRERLARRLDVSRALVWLWESGEQRIPPERVGELRQVLDQAAAPSPMDGAELRRRRQVRGLTQAQLAQRLGVVPSLVGMWERARARITPGRAAQLHQLLQPADGLVAAAVAAVTAESGLTRTALMARLRGSRDRRRAAVQAAIASGKVVERQGAAPPAGQIRQHRGLYPSAAPLRPYDLRTGRHRCHWTQAYLAARLHVPATIVAAWEQGSQPIPAEQAPRLREVLAAGVDLADEEAVRRLVRAAPGSSRTALLRGRGKSCKAALARLLEAGELELRRTPFQDRAGAWQTRLGLFERGSAPEPPRPILRDELLRWPGHLPRADLARRLGLTSGAVNDWFTGKREVPDGRRAAVRAAIQAARSEPAPQPRAAEATRTMQALVALADQRPGLSPTALKVRCHQQGAGTHKAIAQALDRAVAAGLLIWGRAPYRARGLYRAAGPLPAALTADQIHQGRERAGWTQRELAGRLGVPQTTVSGWERGASVPPTQSEALAELLAAAPAAPRRDPDAELLERVAAVVQASPGLAGAAVVARVPGDIRRRWAALRRALAQGLIHERPLTYIDASHRSRTRPAYQPGPAPRGELLAAPAAPSAEELIAGRERAGWTRAELARRLGVSAGNVYGWEQRGKPVPAGRIADVRRLLETAPAAPARDRDAELIEAITQAIAAEPGLTGSAAVAKVRGDVRRRWSALEGAVAAGCVHCRPVPFTDRAGHTRTRPAYYPGPSPA